MTSAFALIAALAFTSLASQAPADKAAAMQESVAALKQSLAENQVALKQYTWTESTVITLKGEVKKQQQKLCRYGPDGKVQKTPLGDQPAAQPKEQPSGRRGGRLKQKVVEKKVGEIKDYMEAVAALVDCTHG